MYADKPSSTNDSVQVAENQLSSDPSEASGFDDKAFEEAFLELNQMIGLKDVKDTIRHIYARTKMYGLGNDGPGRFVFAGNPGTGKTEVGKLLGKVLKAAGALSSGHTHYVNAGDLVAGYVGQTREKTKQVVGKAIDGVLFLDEAYQLTPKEGTGGFIQEAFDELMAQIDANKQRMAVIFAGYKDEMEEFVLGNPGMARRITETIDFPDYTVDELMQIFDLMIAKENERLSEAGKQEIVCDDEFRAELKQTIESESKKENFGNASFIGRLIESAKVNHVERVLAAQKPE